MKIPNYYIYNYQNTEYQYQQCNKYKPESYNSTIHDIRQGRLPSYFRYKKNIVHPFLFFFVLTTIEPAKKLFENVIFVGSYGKYYIQPIYHTATAQI